MPSEPHDNRRKEPRYAVKLDAQIRFTASSQATTAMIKTIGSGLSLNCITHNVSESGVGLLVSARNIDRYLNNAQLQVNIQIQLPAGLIKFGAQATHHQKLVMESASVVYFIGANITSIDARERTLFKSFVRSLAEKS